MSTPARKSTPIMGNMRHPVNVPRLVAISAVFVDFAWASSCDSPELPLTTGHIPFAQLSETRPARHASAETLNQVTRFPVVAA